MSEEQLMEFARRLAAGLEYARQYLPPVDREQAEELLDSFYRAFPDAKPPQKL